MIAWLFKRNLISEILKPYCKIKYFFKNLSWIDLDGKNQSCANSDRCGKGGFMPFGLTGVFSGAAKALFAYGGFDFIAAAGNSN